MLFFNSVTNCRDRRSFASFSLANFNSSDAWAALSFACSVATFARAASFFACIANAELRTVATSSSRIKAVAVANSAVTVRDTRGARRQGRARPPRQVRREDSVGCHRTGQPPRHSVDSDPFPVP